MRTVRSGDLCRSFPDVGTQALLIPEMGAPTVLLEPASISSRFRPSRSVARWARLALSVIEGVYLDALSCDRATPCIAGAPPRRGQRDAGTGGAWEGEGNLIRKGSTWQERYWT